MQTFALSLGSFALLASLLGCRGPEFSNGAGGGGAGSGAGGETGTTTSTGGSGPGSGGGGNGTGGMPPVTFDVTVDFETSDGAALDGRLFQVNDASGDTVRTSGMLGVNGTTTVSVHDGDWVVVFEPPFAADPKRYAYAAKVVEGTTLVQFIHERAPVPNTPVDVTVSVYCGSCTGATTGTLAISCNTPITLTNPSGVISRTINSYAGCPGSTTFDAYFIAYNASGTPIAQSSVTALPLTAGSHQVPEADTVSPGTITWNISGANAGVNFTRNLYTYGSAGNETRLRSIQGTSTTTTLPIETSFVQDVRFETFLMDVPSDILAGRTQRFASYAFQPIDIDATALGWPTVTLVDDADRPGASWTISGPLGDATIVALTSADTIWTLAAPPNTADPVRIPELASEAASFALPRSAVELVGVGHLDDPASGSYVAFLPVGVMTEVVERRDLNDFSFATWIGSY